MDVKERNMLGGGENIVEMVDLEEDNFSVSNSSDADAAFDAVIGSIEDLIMEDDFQHLQQRFMEKHYLEFDDSEENKLTYTPIFNKYEREGRGLDLSDGLVVRSLSSKSSKPITSRTTEPK